MFVGSIDDALMEFIYAANGCLNDAKFVRDERYERVTAELGALPDNHLKQYLGQLEMIASHSKKKEFWGKMIYRFKLDLEVIPV